MNNRNIISTSAEAFVFSLNCFPNREARSVTDARRAEELLT